MVQSFLPHIFIVLGAVLFETLQVHFISHAKLAPWWVIFHDLTVLSEIYYYWKFWSLPISRWQIFSLGMRLQVKWSCPSQMYVILYIYEPILVANILVWRAVSRRLHTG